MTCNKMPESVPKYQFGREQIEFCIPIYVSHEFTYSWWKTKSAAQPMQSYFIKSAYAWSVAKTFCKLFKNVGIASTRHILHHSLPFFGLNCNFIWLIERALYQWHINWLFGIQEGFYGLYGIDHTVFIYDIFFIT